MAKDALGNDVKATTWLATHAAGDRSLTQGLKVRGQLTDAWLLHPVHLIAALLCSKVRGLVWCGSCAYVGQA